MAPWPQFLDRLLNISDHLPPEYRLCHCSFTACIRIQCAFCWFRTVRVVSELVLYLCLCFQWWWHNPVVPSRVTHFLSFHQIVFPTFLLGQYWQYYSSNLYTTIPLNWSQDFVLWTGVLFSLVIWFCPVLITNLLLSSKIANKQWNFVLAWSLV